MKVCYCHTPGCENDGVSFMWDDSPVEIEDGSVIEQSAPWCGACSTELTDISDAPEPEPVEESTEDGG